MPASVGRLLDGPLDIVGDVHGEADALCALVHRLGGDLERGEVARPLIFVGDLVDRGPDSPRVVELVARLVDQGLAQCVLGNHELNLLLGKARQGNGWFMGSPDAFQPPGEPGQRVQFESVPASPAYRDDILDFFARLPLALERPGLRVVHAAWHEPSMTRLRGKGSPTLLARRYEGTIRKKLEAKGTLDLQTAELARWAELKDRELRPTELLQAHQKAAVAQQMDNPVKVLTSGLEGELPLTEMQFAGGRWRQVGRLPWWSEYEDDCPVVVGHYWRDRHDGRAGGFPAAGPFDWLGPRRNVFCVDYSVGRRFMDRYVSRPMQGGLAALRWPERTLVFDDWSEPIETVSNDSLPPL
jgi:hypothetical protein